MDVPSISVVIPAYRAESTIGRAIDSVLAQTVPVAEIIVVDDGSPDNLAAVVEAYRSPLRLVRQSNAKTAIARNTGIERATGDFVAFLDADDYWEPEKLRLQLAVFAKHPEVGIVASRFYCQSPNEPRQVGTANTLRWCDRVLRERGPKAFYLGTMLWTGTVLVRRAALADERFVSGLEPAEDRDLWIRLVAKHPSYLLSNALATAVLEPGGISRESIAGDCTKMLAVIDRHRQMLSPISRFIWRSYICYRWAAIEPAPRIALPLLMQSFVRWPAPLVGVPAMRSLGRLRRLVVLLAQWASGFRARSVRRATS